MKRSYETIDWPMYHRLVEEKQAKKASRKDMYRFIRMTTVVACLVVLIERL